MTKVKLSVSIATFNEELNIGDCLESVKNIADEIVIVDGKSSDRTVEIAKSYGAKVSLEDNNPNFHINKQKSFDLACGEWILYLDADERVSHNLAEEIRRVIYMSSEEIEHYQKYLKNRQLFIRHQQLIEERDGIVGNQNGEYNAFYMPRLNYFLGKYLKFGGVYPDGVIRLFKRGKARLPCKSVHEQMEVEGKTGWLENDLIHIDSPNFKRYLERNSRYIDLMVDQLKKERLSKDIFSFTNYVVLKPFFWFFSTLIRHKGILDGFPGIVFSFFSALRFSRAYFRYLRNS